MNGCNRLRWIWGEICMKTDYILWIGQIWYNVLIITCRRLIKRDVATFSWSNLLDRMVSMFYQWKHLLCHEWHNILQVRDGIRFSLSVLWCGFLAFFSGPQLFIFCLLSVVSLSRVIFSWQLIAPPPLFPKGVRFLPWFH